MRKLTRWGLEAFRLKKLAISRRALPILLFSLIGLSLFSCTPEANPAATVHSPILTTSRTAYSSPIQFSTLTQSPARLNTPTPEGTNPYLGPVPEGAMARLGMGSANDPVFSPDGKDLVVTGTIGVFAYDAGSLSPKWSFTIPGEGMSAPAFSADGRRLAVAAGLETIMVLDSRTGETITAWKTPEVPPDELMPIRALGFSPDGMLLAGISFNGAFLWNSEDGRLLQMLDSRGASDPCGLDFSPDGKVLAGARGERVTLWSIPGGRVIQTLNTDASLSDTAGVENYLVGVKFLPDGKTILTNDGTVWEWRTGKILRVLEDFASAQLSVSSDGALAAGDMGVWDIATGEQIWLYPADRLDRVDGTFFSPQGDLLAVSANTGIILVDSATGQYHKSLDAFFEIVDTAFSSDGKWIVGWNWNCRYWVWDAESLWLRESFSGKLSGSGCEPDSPSGSQYVFSSPVNPGEVRSPDDKLVIVLGGYYERIILREAGNGGRPVAVLPPASGAAFSPDGMVLATAHFDRGILLWDVPALLSGESPLPLDLPTPEPSTPTVRFPLPTVPLMPSRKLNPDAGAIVGLSYLPDQSTLTVLAADGVFQVHQGDLQEKWRWEFPQRTDTAAVSPDGALVAAGRELWDVAASRLLRTLSVSDSDTSLRSPAFSADGKFLAFVTERGIAVLSTVTGDLLHWNDGLPENTIDDLVFSPDGNTLAIGVGTDFYLWDLVKDAVQGPEFANCRGDVTFDQAFSPDGGILLIACGPLDYPLGFISFWDVSLRRLVDFWDETASIHRLAVSSDGKWTAMGLYDGGILLWGSGIKIMLPGHGESGGGNPLGPNGEVLGSEHEVTALAFSADGRTLASGSLDGSLILTDLSPLAGLAGSNDSKYASDAAPSGCALEPGYVVHARANARIWSLPDVSSGNVIREPSAGQALYMLGGPVEGWIRTDKSAKGWFWEVSLDADGKNPGWIWQTRIEECPEKF